jgi:hypothetical protein
MIIFLRKMLKKKVFRGYMKQNETIFIPKIPLIYNCIYCDYNTSSKKDFNKHIQTQKHKMKQNETSKSPNDKLYQCVCGVMCNSRTTLWRHKKKCQTNNNNDDHLLLVEYLMKENAEFKPLHF